MKALPPSRFVRPALVLVLASAAGLLLACSEPSQVLVEKELFVEGVESRVAKTFDDVEIELTSGEIAFGPVYLCSGPTAGELCDTARMEWLESRVIQVIGAGRTPVGTLEGLTGTVRSWMLDYGLVSKLTSDDYLEMPARKDLGGSVVVEGFALKGGVRLPFVARLDVEANLETGKGVPAISMPASPALSLEVTEAAQSLSFRFSPSTWISSSLVPWLFEEQECSAESTLTCLGQFAQSCDPASGALASTEDCAEKGLVCAPRFGCVETLEVDEEDGLGRALLLEVVGAGRPSLSLRNE